MDESHKGMGFRRVIFLLLTLLILSASLSNVGASIPPPLIKDGCTTPDNSIPFDILSAEGKLFTVIITWDLEGNETLDVNFTFYGKPWYAKDYREAGHGYATTVSYTHLRAHET